MCRLGLIFYKSGMILKRVLCSFRTLSDEIVIQKSIKWDCLGFHRLVFLLALLLCIVLQSLSASSADSEIHSSRTIHVVMDNNYPPYVFLDGGGILKGILVDQWRLWQEKTGIRVEIKAMDWGTALKGMKNGEFDVIDTIFETDERSSWMDFTKPYARLDVPVFFNREINGKSDVDSLKGFAVAAKVGDAAVELLRSHGVENLILFDGYETIIRAAKEHKVNVFVVDKPPALYFLYKYGIQEQYKESRSLYAGEFHRAVKKGETALLREIETGFARMSAQELQKIEGKWYGSPLVKNTPVRYFLIIAGVLYVLILSCSQ
jgi:two-component system, cell cycle sensor histidine kinase and response regulator CckA